MNANVIFQKESKKKNFPKRSINFVEIEFEKILFDNLIMPDERQLFSIHVRGKRYFLSLSHVRGKNDRDRWKI